MSKVWGITGAAAGIGQALAQAALARGDRVYGLVRRAEHVAPFEALAPGRAVALLADVTDTAAVNAAARRVEADGGLDVLVNNAATGMVGAVEESTAEQIRFVFEVNLFGLIEVTRAFLPMLRASRGRILNISSGVGLCGMPGMPIYSASKAAVEGLSEALSGELAESGVRVSLVEPGAVQTGFAVANAVEAANPLASYAGLTGGGRESLRKYYGPEATPPEEVAAAILGLADAAEPPLRLVIGGSRYSAAARRDLAQAAIDGAI